MKAPADRSAAFRILLLGNDSLFFEGLRKLLEGLPRPTTVVRLSQPDDLAAPTEPAFDLAILDALPPGADRVAAVGEARERLGRRTPLAVLALAESPGAVRTAIAAGAAGVIPVFSPLRVVRHAVELMLSGGIYLPASVLGGSGEAAEPAASTATAPARLTRRQSAVLLELAKGQSNKQIAGALGLSEATVKVHIAAIMRSLKAHNRTQAVVAATETGMLGDAVC